MFNWIRTLKRVKSRTKRTYSDQFTKDNDDKYIIKLKVSSLDTLMNSYCINGYKSLNHDMCEDIESVVSNLPSQNGVNFEIDVTNSDPKTIGKTKEEFANAFKHKYVLDSLSNERHKKLNVIIAWICMAVCLFFTGILVTIDVWALYDTSIQEFFEKIDSLWEVIVIIVWVFGWEFFDRMAFMQSELNHKQIRNFQLYHANIRYVKNKNSQITQDIDPFTFLPTFQKINSAAEKKEERENSKIDNQKKSTN